MDTRRLLNAIWRKAWIIVLFALLGGGIAGYFAFYKTTPTYKANTTLYVINLDAVLQKGHVTNQNDLTFAYQLISNYNQIMKSQRVSFAAADILRAQGFSYINKYVIKNFVTLQINKDSNILVVTAAWTDPKTAVAISNAMTKGFINSLSELTGANGIAVLDEAQNAVPVSNDSLKKIMIGVLEGLALGFGIIYTMEVFDTTLRAVEDIEQGSNLSVVGVIPNHQMK